MILNSIFKKNGVFGVFRTCFTIFFRAWIDFIFPPLCASCRAACQTSFFCPICWELCSPCDPTARCSHCFREIGDYSEKNSFELCPQCRKEPFLAPVYASVFEPTAPVKKLYLQRDERPEAIAAFFMYQWARLNWSQPQVIVPMPGTQMLVKLLSVWMEAPQMNLLRNYSGNWECQSEKVEEDQIFLLIDFNSSLFQLQKAATALSEAFPKRVYVLSLIHYDFSFAS